MRISTLVIVGVGLIGGSIALAARRRGIAARIVGVVRRPDALAQALGDGLLDEGYADLSAAVAEAELVVFARRSIALLLRSSRRRRIAGPVRS